MLHFWDMRHIDIDDSQSVLRAIRETPPGRTIEIILHTPGGLVLAASQIAQALSDRQVEVLCVHLLERHMEPTRARELAHLLATGVWTHDHPLMASELEPLGLTVRVGVPSEERTLMDLYPQPRGREAAVEYFTGPRLPGLRDSSRRTGASRRG